MTDNRETGELFCPAILGPAIELSRTAEIPVRMDIADMHCGCKAGPQRVESNEFGVSLPGMAGKYVCGKTIEELGK